MLGTIINLFGKSPFALLQLHMEKVTACVSALPALFKAIEEKRYDDIEKIARSISEHEHAADLVKNNIRNHLPKSLFLALDRGQLLEILTLQDSIADSAEDVAVLTTLKHLDLFPSFKETFFQFLGLNIEAFQQTHQIMREMHDLLESSFGGIEAEKVKRMVDQVAKCENDADLLQRELLRNLYKSEGQLTYITFDLWQKIFGSIAKISNISEKLAFRVRMTLELRS